MVYGLNEGKQKINVLGIAVRRNRNGQKKKIYNNANIENIKPKCIHRSTAVSIDSDADDTVEWLG